MARQASSPSLFASVRAVPWADEAEQQLFRLGLWMRALCRGLHFGSRAAGDLRHGPPKLRLKLEEAREASSPSLCASVREVPWADEAKQQLCRQSLSGCELSADVRILGAGLPDVPGTGP